VQRSLVLLLALLSAALAAGCGSVRKVHQGEFSLSAPLEIALDPAFSVREELIEVCVGLPDSFKVSPPYPMRDAAGAEVRISVTLTTTAGKDRSLTSWAYGTRDGKWMVCTDGRTVQSGDSIGRIRIESPSVLRFSGVWIGSRSLP
jgi:hypothetical protein